MPPFHDSSDPYPSSFKVALRFWPAPLLVLPGVRFHAEPRWRARQFGGIHAEAEASALLWGIDGDGCVRHGAPPPSDHLSSRLNNDAKCLTSRRNAESSDLFAVFHGCSEKEPNSGKMKLNIICPVAFIQLASYNQTKRGQPMPDSTTYMENGFLPWKRRKKPRGPAGTSRI